MTYLWMLWNNFVSVIEERREEGQDLVEYALIIALIAILLIAALLALGGEISNTFSDIQSGLNAGT